jgi:cysteine synthase A
MMHFGMIDPSQAAFERRCSPISITDEEAVAMARYLVKNDGLFLGSSSACNLIACIKLVKKLEWKDGQHVVTIL